MSAEPEPGSKGPIPFLDRSGNEFLERLAEDPYRFDFFQAVRRLDALELQPRTGHSTNPSREPVRFGQAPSSEFAPSTLASFEFGAGQSPAELNAKLLVYFLGLCGPNGPMPLGFTEFIYRRTRGIVDPDSPTYDAVDPVFQTRTQPDSTLTDFLDIFHHRILSLFYRAWAETKKAVDYDRPDDQAFARFFGSLIGIGMPSLTGRNAVPDDAKYYFAGHLACQTRHADGLASILEDYHNVPAQIVEFVGHWLPLPESSVCRLGESPATGRLGDSLVIGTRYWDCQLRFRIRLGPMAMEDYERFLPGTNSSSLRDLRLWVLHYVGYDFFVDVQIVLRREDVTPIALGVSGRLGYTTWLKDEISPFPRDADDLILPIQLEEETRSEPVTTHR